MTYPCSGCGLRSCDGRCFDECAADYPPEPETKAKPRKYTPSPEYLEWCREVDAKREPLTTCAPDPLKHLDPLLKKRRVG
jgi:hypothetical protein